MGSELFEVLPFGTQVWQAIPQVDEAQMREVDRVAVEDFQLGVLQMMENAGRNLAGLAYQHLQQGFSLVKPQKVLVLAGSGGNGGGGLCAARHLHNHGFQVLTALTRPAESLTGPAAVQLAILQASGLAPCAKTPSEGDFEAVDLVLDALIGYSLNGPPRGPAKRMIERLNASGKPVISLDLPSGLEASQGETPGVCVRADQTLSLALPKPGLLHPDCGALFLADIGIPPEVYHSLGIRFAPFFGGRYVLPMRKIRRKLQ